VAAITATRWVAGASWPLCADVRIAADDATLGQPEILLGVIPGPVARNGSHGW
jgi:enoyl-CoA hydratase/carnithine racemase